MKITKMIPVNAPVLGEQEKLNVQECLDTGWISSAGKFVSEFEQKFAEFSGCEFGVSTTNGTAAIHLALKSLGVGSGDDVIIPSFTMAGSVYPIVQAGAKPIFVDCDLDTFNVTVADIEKRITPQTKAIIVVHLYGHPVDMDPIMAFAKARNIFVIEDAAEAHGARYKDRKVGSIGDIGCYSFYANKIITTGEGGMLVTNNQKYANLARRLKDLGHGEKRFTHDLPEAFNYRMTNIQAAIGLGQLHRAGEIIDRKIKNAHHYTELLSNQTALKTPVCRAWAKCVYWMYGVVVTEDSPLTKLEWMAALKERGVDTRSFFYPLDQQHAFSDHNSAACPNAAYVGEHGFYLPSGQSLSDDDIVAVVKAIEEILEEKS